MKTLVLFDVPKTHPNRKERIEAFKKQYDIQTHSSLGCGEDWDKWVAMHMPTARRIGYGYGVTKKSDMFDCISKVCRLLDDANVLGYGKTERLAIQQLCDKVQLPFTL